MSHSPTGSAVIPAKFVPIASVLVATLTSVWVLMPEGQPKNYVLAATILIGSLAGINMVGWRKGSPPPVDVQGSPTTGGSSTQALTAPGKTPGEISRIGP